MSALHPDAPHPAVMVQDLSRHFGSRRALDGVSLTVPRGSVFGLVGENGAGKTTLIKHLLGLLRAEMGSVRVLGLDPVSRPAAVLSRVGYLAENRDLPLWMRMQELLDYTAAFYPDWDAAYAGQLLEQFQLPAATRLKHLSRGELAKAGLLVALAHRPELLILDEPSSGLDPLVRRDILEAIIRTVAEEGRTVLFSSHLLDEIERVADHIAMMVNGKVILAGSLDEIRARHRKFVLRFDATPPSPPFVAGALSVSGSGLEWTILACEARETIAETAQKIGARIVEEHVPSLEEIFLARASRKISSTHLP